MEQLLIELATKYQWFMVICIVVGISRLVFKPLIAIIDSIVIYTPSASDDSAWAKFKDTWFFKGLEWVMNYLLSIKLPGQK